MGETSDEARSFECWVCGHSWDVAPGDADLDECPECGNDDIACESEDTE